MEPNNQQGSGQQFFQPDPYNNAPQQPQPVGTPYATPGRPAAMPQYQQLPPAQSQYAQPTYESPLMGTQTPVVPQLPAQKKSHAKVFIVAIVIVLLVAGGITAVLLMHKDKKAPAKAAASNSQKKTSSSASSFVPATKKACDILTLSEAQKFLGGETTASSTNGAGDTKSPNESVTTCAYTMQLNGTTTQVTLQVTGALTAAAAAQLKVNLQNLKAQYPNGDTLESLGDDAYFAPALGELEVIDGNYGLSINAGTVNNGNLTANLSLASQIADIAVGNLK